MEIIPVDITVNTNRLFSTSVKLYGLDMDIGGKLYTVTMMKNSIPLFDLVRKGLIEVNLHIVGTARKGWFLNENDASKKWTEKTIINSEKDSIKVDVAGWHVLRQDKIKTIRRYFIRALAAKYGRVVNYGTIRAAYGDSFMSELAFVPKFHSGKYVTWFKAQNATVHEFAVTDNDKMEFVRLFQLGKAFAWEREEAGTATYVFFSDDPVGVTQIIDGASENIMAMLNPKFQQEVGMRIERVIHAQDASLVADLPWEQKVRMLMV